MRVIWFGTLIQSVGICVRCIRSEIIEPVVHAVTLCVVLFVARDLFGFGSLANIFLVGIAHDFILKNFLNSQLPELPETGMRILLFTVFAGLFLLAAYAGLPTGFIGTFLHDALRYGFGLGARRPII